jgi:release factor glutamine methyltransferase
MTIADWLILSTNQLKAAGIATARLDSLVLLEDQLGIDRARLLAHPERIISANDKNVLTTQLESRSGHLPLAYVRQKTEFYGRSFRITSDVLEPRPESETMIDMLKNLVAQPSLMNSLLNTTNTPLKSLESPVAVLQTSNTIRIADVGSGSGALGITAKLELPNCEVDLLEIDKLALIVAESNVVLHTLSISVIKSDLLLNSSNKYDILMCNLPYIPDDFRINIAASHEPKVAIFGGPDGLSLYRRLFSDMPKLQHSPLYVLTEALPSQHAELSAIASKNNYQLVKADDFIQLYKKIG